MRKQLISVMLCLAALGGLMTYPMPVSASVLQSQTIKTQGQVVDEQGEPLIGVNVMVKGSRTGAVTDLDGKFQLEVPANAEESRPYGLCIYRECRGIEKGFKLQYIDNA